MKEDKTLKDRLPTITWRHPDGRTIRVNADHKVREGYPHDPDHWKILYRANVPNLTNAEWYAAPNSEWTQEGRLSAS